MISFDACTIVSKNYLPFARTLARSFLEHHPERRFFVLLVDRVDGFFDPAAEPFVVIEAESLDNLPDFRSFAFKYTVLEINTAVKPFFLEHLLTHHGVERIVYFDPDILVTHELAALARRLEEATIVLTPHLTEPIADERHPGELAILQAGAYNLGFIGVCGDPEGRRFLTWWQQRVYDDCVVRVDRGLFVDQKWIDLVPGMFSGVEILTDRGYNVAYWNLHGRRVAPGATVMADGGPLYFFHFSGIDCDHLERVSKHQDRFRLRDLPELRGLFEGYCERLRAAGWHETRGWPYAYGRFDNGVAIPDLARSLYHELADRRGGFGDPFAAAAEGSFFAWLNRPAGGGAAETPYVSHLLEHLVRTRPDLQIAFPDPCGADRVRFAEWMRHAGRFDYALEEVFLAPVAPGPAAVAPRGLRGRFRRLARRLYLSEASRRLRAVLRTRLGAARFERLRSRLPFLPSRPSGGSLPASGSPPSARPPVAPGLNIVGYIHTESGMGAGVRSIIRAVEAAGLPHSLHDVELNVLSRREDHSFTETVSRFEHPVNLFFVNADQAELVRSHVGSAAGLDRTNIGFWLWELERFPARWFDAFELYDEVWTPSGFCLEAISRVSPVPVVRIPLPVAPAPAAGIGRAELGLPAGAFLVLFVFDFLSYAERKNPFGLVTAFRRAFPPGSDTDAFLLLKSINGELAPRDRARLEREIEGLPARLVDGYYDGPTLHALLAACDCYASLHRSEGFGLTIAEAMALGKPVVATDYSANTDFMTLANSLPVAYRLVEIGCDEGPYERGNRWADPDLDHAAVQLRRLYDDRGLAAELGRRASDDVRRELSTAAVGAAIRARLERAPRLDGVRHRSAAAAAGRTARHPPSPTDTSPPGDAPLHPGPGI